MNQRNQRDPKPASPDRLRSTKLNPGDQAAPGTPGTAENICPVCSGKGKIGDRPCQHCGGTGKVIEGIGGA